MGDVRILDIPVMTTREAAHQLRIPPSTFAHWLEGGQRGKRWYPPVLREEPNGSLEVTWGEMVEARYLRAYRQKSVSMQRLRPFIGLLRREFGVPYPLAHFRPWVDESRRLLVRLQEESHLPAQLWAVFETSDGQLVLNPLIREGFLDRVDFSTDDDGPALRIRPRGKTSPVVLDPYVSSAAATVHGIRTEILAEHVSAGARVIDVADDFDLPVGAVKAALAYEWEAAA